MKDPKNIFFSINMVTKSIIINTVSMVNYAPLIFLIGCMTIN